MNACAAQLLQLPAPVILASASPRRQQLITLLGIDVSVIPAAVDEDAFDRTMPRQYVEVLAQAKAAAVRRLHPESIVIGADTTVVLDGQVLNKPRDRDDAVRMLRLLSGRTHTVITGVCVLWQKVQLVDSRITHVTFRSLSEEEIAAYVASGSPLDKAGAYGIQDDCGATFVDAIEGCYYTVVGLPIALLYRMLRLLRVFTR
ncbi:MAG: Maf family protein [Bacteroidota bacterium]|nr:Maf family protein [Candidatus Kapabacteria bacterium]MCS7303357.1 Maf family protein [Candidatus Kapabacteria bacterium]MDW8271750.1 Maf family protein [Bacteroidota bacterium]